MTIKLRKERMMLRVVKGALIPADSYTEARLRDRGYKIGDIVSADIKKPRHPKFHGLVHQLGALVAENIESFSGMKAHAVLKRLQWEGNIGCEEMGVMVPGVGMAMIRTPKSLGYESMDQGEFYEVMRAFCNWISEKYWPSLDAEQIEQMAGVMVEPA